MSCWRYACYVKGLCVQAPKPFVVVAQRFVIMFPWAHFRRTACCDDDGGDEEIQRSDARAATQPDEKTDCSMTKVEVGRGDPILGHDQTEFADDLTDVEDNGGDGVGAAAAGAEPPAKKFKECDEHAPQGTGS